MVMEEVLLILISQSTINSNLTAIQILDILRSQGFNPLWVSSFDQPQRFLRIHLDLMKCQFITIRFLGLHHQHQVIYYIIVQPDLTAVTVVIATVEEMAYYLR